jgi:hypothetical protein
LLQPVPKIALCYGVLNGIAHLCEHLCEFFPYPSENAITILSLRVCQKNTQFHLYRMTFRFPTSFLQVYVF